MKGYRPLWFFGLWAAVVIGAAEGGAGELSPRWKSPTDMVK